MPLNPKTKPYKQKSAQEVQDDLFRKMSADRKIEFASQLWQLAKELDSDKINYGVQKKGNHRTAASPRYHRRDS